MSLTDIYLTVSQVSILLPILAGIRYYKYLTKPFRILFYFFVLTIPFEIIGEVTRRVFHNNMPGQHALTFVEFMAFSSVFYFHSAKNGPGRRLILINPVVFSIIALLNATVIGDGIMAPNDLSRGYSYASMIIYILTHYYSLFQRDDILYVWEYPMFWICTGGLLYYAVTFIYVIMRSDLVKEYVDPEWNAHLVHAGLNIIASLLFAQSFRCLGNKKIQSSHFYS